MYFKKISFGYVDCIEMAEDWFQWHGFVLVVLNVWILVFEIGWLNK
jgi:hypothetical protein